LRAGQGGHPRQGGAGLDLHGLHRREESVEAGTRRRTGAAVASDDALSDAAFQGRLSGRGGVNPISMSSSGWMIVGWVFLAILTAINIFIFLKLKNASEQMLKMAFPGAKDMNEAVAQMQKMMGGMGGRPGMKGGNPFGGMAGPRGGSKANDAQLRAAMEML